MKYVLSLFVGLVLSLGSQVYAQVVYNEPAPDFTLTDTNGKTHSLSDFKGKYVVLEWNNFECPFVVKHYGSNNMQTLQKEMTDKGVVWLTINSSAEGKEGYFDAQQTNAMIAERNAAPTAYLLDSDGKVGKMYKAKTTPHMYVIHPDGRLIYQGAIDSNSSFDPAVIPTSTNYVRKAIEESMAGNDPTENTTTPYGCSVKY